MATPMRVTGAWVQLLTDWLDQENLPAPELRSILDSRGPADIVALPLWRELLERAVALRPGLPAPGLAIGALVQPRHVGVLGYLTLTCQTLGEVRHQLPVQLVELRLEGVPLLRELVVGAELPR